MILYHWWPEKGDPPVWANHRAPIILSIATLRACNPDVPIMVRSGEEADWAHFPEKLNFVVEVAEPTLSWAKDKVRGWKHLSRIIDIHGRWRNKTDEVVYCDSDVFWIRDPYPLACEAESGKFCFDGWNTGFFYYRPMYAKEFAHIFKAYVSSAIYSKDIRNVLKKHVGYDAWYDVWDEMILTYMRHEHPDLFTIIPKYEHACMRDIFKINPDEIKMFHCNGLMVSNEVTEYEGLKEHSRGLFCLIFEEFYQKIASVLSYDDLSMVYTEAEREFYLPKQTKFREAVGRMVQDKDGLYHTSDLFT